MPSLHARGKSRSPKPLTDLVTMNPPSRSHCSCVIYAIFRLKSAWGVSGNPQPLPACLPLHCWSLPLHSCMRVVQPRSLGRHGLREQRPHLPGSSGNSTRRLCHRKQSSVTTRRESPELKAKSLPLQLSHKNSQKGNLYDSSPVLQNLAWVQAAYCYHNCVEKQ